MDYYNYFLDFEKFIIDGDLKGAEDFALKTSKDLGLSDRLLKTINNINLSNYEKSIEEAIPEAIEVAKEFNAKAIYFDYDIDNDWDSYLFICSDYNSVEDGIEDWSTKWVASIITVSLFDYADIFLKEANQDFFEGKHDTAILLMLIARTNILFAKAALKYKDCGFKICIGYHDQDIATRIVE